ncbi:D-amino acid dehydrogenase [Jiella sp. MQZ9-1]|uniref:D-amino acid dehydrogenase n=1 Tax=Jiella flava TaxID=2816857 RepID=A0A939JX53_9HYPH|nr:D-amino acid dehydrogenase [Jiella flava]MBO0664234.1 D-amino acid dehydrogenase [Jiella flava]MCD2472880.1 D-amino acid dehydrogenase [Jiella flava]
MSSIAVIGAGITGITTAYKLLARGFDVTVFDRHPYAAMETSFANGGQLSASNAEVWNQPSTVLKGIKWMLTKDAPLLVNPKPSWHKLSWMAEFVLAARNYEQNTIATTRLAIEAREHLLAMADREGFSFDIEKRGILHVYEEQREFEHAAKVNRLLERGGLKRIAVTSDEIAAIEPTIHGQFIGGFFTESDFTGDIHKYTRNLAEACRRHGAKLNFAADVTKLRARGGDGVDVMWRKAGTTGEASRDHFDAIVVCAGVASRKFAAQLGDRVNVYPVKGYSITVNLSDAESQAAAPRVSILDDHAKIVTSRLGDDRLRIAGTAEFTGENRDIRNDRIRPLIDWCRLRFPGASTASVVPWAGLRPMMPNMMPRVRAGRRPGVFYNTGHGHLGWTLSAITAEMIAGEVEAAQARRSRPVQGARAEAHGPLAANGA